MEAIQKPIFNERLTRGHFVRRADYIAKDLLGRVIVSQAHGHEEVYARIKEVAAWEGEEKSSAKTIKYGPGLVGVSKKHGKSLIDIGTSSQSRASCVTLIALETPEGIIQGPARVANYLHIDDMFDGAPIDDPFLWIGGEIVNRQRVTKRAVPNAPGNCLGYFYYK